MILDLLFPKTCLACGSLGSYICLNCQKNIEFIEKDTCIYCFKSSPLGLTHINCKRKDGIDGVMSSMFYNPTVRSIIKNIKYRLVTDAFKELFSICSYESISKLKLLGKLRDDYTLQPIPLHKNRERVRGFNQSLVIAQFFSSIVDKSVIYSLIRVKETKPQAQIKDKKERYRNIKDAFTLKDKEELANQTIVLVDDVVTSSSTVKEAARILKQHGAQSVFVFSLARG